MTRPNEESPSGQGRGFQNTQENANAATVAPAQKKGKDFAKLQAQFALLGRELTRCCRAHDGHTTVSYTVTRFGEPRYFSQLHDVSAHLLQIGRRP